MNPSPLPLQLLGHNRKLDDDDMQSVNAQGLSDKELQQILAAAAKIDNDNASNTADQNTPTKNTKQNQKGLRTLQQPRCTEVSKSIILEEENGDEDDDDVKSVHPDKTKGYFNGEQVDTNIFLLVLPTNKAHDLQPCGVLMLVLLFILVLPCAFTFHS